MLSSLVGDLCSTFVALRGGLNMLQKSLLSMLLVLTAFGAYATEDIVYNCTKDGATRIIGVDYQSDTAKVPCQVTYQKGNGEIKTLWRAQHKEGYCEEKAVVFVQKQSNWGWQCSTAQ